MEHEGRISEWNEGTFKSSRLHETQDNINALRIDPLSFTDGKFNYEWLFSFIDNLYHEGYSKYSKKEREEVDNIREVIIKAIRYLPPTTIVIEESYEGNKKGFIVDPEKYDKLMEIIMLFERKVKDYNDKHGLTTTNRMEHGGWD